MNVSGRQPPTGSKPSDSPVAGDTAAENPGGFRRWFPGWGGWYGSSTSVADAPSPDTGQQPVIPTVKLDGGKTLPISKQDQDAIQKEKEIGLFNNIWFAGVRFEYSRACICCFSAL